MNKRKAPPTGRPISIWFTFEEIEILDAVVEERRKEMSTFSRSALVHELVGETLFSDEGMNMLELMKTDEFQKLISLGHTKEFQDSYEDMISKIIPKELLSDARKLLGGGGND